MRSERIAEWVLSLFAPEDRAVAIVGDFIEDAGERGRFWFWLHVTRVGIALLWSNLLTAPIRMICSAMLGWFVYMAANLVLWCASFIAVTLLWGMGYFFTHHSGPGLLSDMLRLRFDWPRPPSGALHAAEIIVVWIVAPFQVGRFTARCWPGREVAAWVVLSIVWPFLSIQIPFLAISTGVTLAMLPAIQALVLLGVLWQCKATRRDLQLKPV